MWFNCQVSVLFDVAPDSDSHRFPYYTDNNRRRWITARCTHSPLSAHTHTHSNTHTAHQSCPEQSLPPQRNFNILTVTADISTNALCQFTAHLRQPATNKCSPIRQWMSEWKWRFSHFKILERVHTHEKVFFVVVGQRTGRYDCTCNLHLKCVIYEEEDIIPGESHVLAFPFHPIEMSLIGVCRMNLGSELQGIWHNFFIITS